MGKQFTLTTADAASSSAPIAPIRPGAPKGGIVVIQEIFGVNHHIRAVCDRLAGDRLRRGGAGGVRPLRERFRVRLLRRTRSRNARSFVANPDWDAMMHDTDAAIDDLKAVGPVGIVGFCMGGTDRVPRRHPAVRPERRGRLLRRQIAEFADEKPKCPMQLHFGEKDASIPMTDVETDQAEAAATAKSTSIRTARTASIATSAAASTRTPRPRLAAHASRISGKIDDEVKAQYRRGDRTNGRSLFAARLCRVPLEPPLLDHDGVAGPQRIVERHVAVDLLAAAVAGQIRPCSLIGARREAAGDRDRRLRRHVGDVRILPRRGDLAEDEERPVGLDLDRDMRLAHIALLEPLGDRAATVAAW